jgi:hypothetical protein
MLSVLRSLSVGWVIKMPVLMCREVVGFFGRPRAGHGRDPSASLGFFARVVTLCPHTRLPDVDGSVSGVASISASTRPRC